MTKVRLKPDLQLLRRQVLVLVLRARVEHVEQCLLGEVRHLLLNGLCVPDCVALWEAKLWLWRLWWLVTGERESLLGNATATISLVNKISREHGDEAHSRFAAQIKTQLRRIQTVDQGVVRRVFRHQRQQALYAPFVCL